MKFVFTLLTFCYCNLLLTQLEFEKLEVDFGKIKSLEDRIIDVSVKNRGNKREFFLSFRSESLQSKEVSVLTKGEFVLPDSTSFIRVQVNPKKSGVFKYKVNFYTSDSDEVKVLSIKGDLEIEPENTSAYQACPSFNQRPAIKKQNHELKVTLIDARTSKPINAQALLIQNGLDFLQIPLKNGQWKGVVSDGFTYAIIKHPDYYTLDTSFYLEKNQKELFLKINPKNQVPEIDKSVISKVEVDPEIPVKVDSVLFYKSFPNENDEVNLDDIPFSNFDTSYFKPLNVVFVLDVSTSMASNGKIDLLKYSLYQLLAVLRSQDMIGLVTYSNEATVLLKSTSGNEKELILGEIKKLHTSGMTAGMDGIKLGFKQVERHRIQDGVNQVILITDGAFNKNNGDYLGLIEKYTAKGIIFSVVGIKNSDRDIVNMKEAALKGSGVYIPINKMEEADRNIIEQLRRQTFKQKK